MDFERVISNFAPSNEQESSDRRVMLEFIRRFRENVLLRDNEIAHVTSSGFVMNPALDKVLLIYHNLRAVWAWPGGHADGDPNLLRVALREAREETGVSEIRPLCEQAASVDILPVLGHRKGGKYVGTHLHLSVAYLLVCGEARPLRAKPDENAGAAWFETSRFTDAYFSPPDVYLYRKLIDRAQVYKK